MGVGAQRPRQGLPGPGDDGAGVGVGGQEVLQDPQGQQEGDGLLRGQAYRVV